jgi:hypothetical protein
MRRVERREPCLEWATLGDVEYRIVDRRPGRTTRSRHRRQTRSVAADQAQHNPRRRIAPGKRGPQPARRASNHHRAKPGGQRCDAFRLKVAKGLTQELNRFLGAMLAGLLRDPGAL